MQSGKHNYHQHGIRSANAHHGAASLGELDRHHRGEAAPSCLRARARADERLPPCKGPSS